MAATKKKWKPSQLEEGICFRCGEYTDKIVKKDGRCVHCYEAEELSEVVKSNECKDK